MDLEHLRSGIHFLLGFSAVFPTNTAKMQHHPLQSVCGWIRVYMGPHKPMCWNRRASPCHIFMHPSASGIPAASITSSSSCFLELHHQRWHRIHQRDGCACWNWGTQGGSGALIQQTAKQELSYFNFPLQVRCMGFLGTKQWICFLSSLFIWKSWGKYFPM